MKEGQDNIYYFIGANRKMADSSPYMEALLKSGQEVLYCYEPFDDIVFSQVRGFEGKNFVSVESSNVDIIDGADDDSDSADTVKVADQDGMAAWLQVTLGDRVSKVKPSTRLVSHPAIISDEVASGSMRRMMRMLQEKDDSVEEPAVPPQELEVNFGHPLLVKLEGVKDTDPELAAMVTASAGVPASAPAPHATGRLGAGVSAFGCRRSIMLANKPAQNAAPRWCTHVL